jgi:hypothetical protein
LSNNIPDEAQEDSPGDEKSCSLRRLKPDQVQRDPKLFDLSLIARHPDKNPASLDTTGIERQHRSNQRDEWRNYRIVAAGWRIYTRSAMLRLDAAGRAP